MTIETKLCPDPDFFILADSQTSLLLAINLINSSSELYSSSITKVFTIYKNTIVTLGDIVDNKLNSLSHPQVILNKYEGMKLKNDIFDLKKGNDLVTFGMFISNLIKDSINESVYLTEDINDLSIDFLTNARTSNLTFKDLFNSLLKSTKNNDKSHYGVPLVSNVDEYDFLSGIYPNSKFIRLFDDSTEKNKAKPTNQLTNNSNKFLDVTFSQLLNSSKDILLEISAFILKKNDMDLESSFSSQLVNNNLKLNSEYVNNLDHKKPPGAPPPLDPSLFKDPDFFISGPPRSGTSLLTVLLNDHNAIAVAQDTGVYSEFITAATWLIHVYKGQFEGHLNFGPDPLLKEDFGELIRKRPIDLTSRDDNLLINFYYTCLIRFLAHDFFVPDPRKDRGTGIKYLKYINFNIALKTIKESNLPFLSLLNYFVNSIINGEGISGSIRGEKTPTHTLHPAFLRKAYPNAKFINMIRNPIGYIGSRHQRLNIPMGDHCIYYRSIIEQMIENDGRSITIKYEDLIKNPDITISKLHRFLGVNETPISDNLNPGSYPKYVGSKIDKSRDKQNHDFLTSDMKNEIKYHLKDLFELYYPNLL